MGSPIWTTMHIGGAIAPTKLEKLKEIAETEFRSGSPSAEIDAAIAEGRCATLQDHVNFGDPDELIAFCRMSRLTYWLLFDGYGGEWVSGIQIWRPGMDKAARIECDAQSKTCEPVLSLSQLRDHLQKGQRLAQAVDALAEFEGGRVPPLSVRPTRERSRRPAP